MFSHQQERAAFNIYNSAYLENGVRYAILMSKCQSGKTGAYNSLIALMLRMGSIDRAYILCGSHETELREQAIEDTKRYHGAAMYEAGTIQVLFRQDFDGVTMDIRRALIVVDESHLDQGKGQKLDRFLTSHGISMDGNPATLNANDTYILSVDATPYSELAALHHKETPYRKHVEELIPGEGYIGIDHYHYIGRLHKTFNLMTPIGIHRFRLILRSRGNKYALLRFTSGRAGRANPQEEAVRRMGFPVLEFTAERTEINITRPEVDNGLPCLEDAPACPTIVIIRGRLRAGKVVPKKHISLVWEGAKTSKTDALVQGLPGRMCGYAQREGEEDSKKLDRDNLPLLYVPELSLRRDERKIVSMSEMERATMTPDILPTKATNLKKPRVASVATRTQCTPFRLSWPRGAHDEYDLVETINDPSTTEAMRKEHCLNVMRDNTAIIRDSPQLSPEQKSEILSRLETITPSATHIRNLKNESQATYFKAMKEAHENGSTPAEHIPDCPHVTFLVVYRGYRGEGESPFHFYVIFYTDAKPGAYYLRSTHLESRIPKTNGKSIFSVSNRALNIPLTAAGVTGFSEASLASPRAFEMALREYLTHWRTATHLEVSREISSVENRFAMNKAMFHYIGSRSNDVEVICMRVGTEFGVRLKTKYGRGTAGAGGHFNLKSISW